MSEPRDEDLAVDDADFEVVDALPVVGAMPPPPAPEPARNAAVTLSSPVVQVAAVAATGFAIGAATMAVARARSARKPAKRGVTKRDLADVVGSRTFLVDVHLLNRN